MSAEDDALDAFFEEVSTIEKTVEKEISNDETTIEATTTTTTVLTNDTITKEPPNKKTRIAPKIIVASSTAAPTTTTKSKPSTHATIITSNHPTTTTATTTPKQPSHSLKTIPPPPPPPPLPPGPPPTQSPPNKPTHSIKPHRRAAAGKTWLDPTLSSFPENDYRLFVGNIAKDITKHYLIKHFQCYESFVYAKICYDKHNGNSRGYGFVSFMDPKDAARALREKDQSWLGSRPIRLRRSEWKDREENQVVKKERKENKKRKGRFGLL